MNGQDQASGLRKWANLQRQHQQAGIPADVAAVEYVPELAPSLLAPTVAVVEKPVPEAPPKPQIPLMVVGLPGSGALNVNKVKARLGQWSALGRSWAGDPNDWDIRIVKVETADLAQLRAQYSRWALWINSDAAAFSAMFRTLRQLRERGGPNRLLALHEPHLPRQGLLDNLHDAADYYLNTELLILAR